MAKINFTCINVQLSAYRHSPQNNTLQHFCRFRLRPLSLRRIARTDFRFLNKFPTSLRRVQGMQNWFKKIRSPPLFFLHRGLKNMQNRDVTRNFIRKYNRKSHFFTFGKIFHRQKVFRFFFIFVFSLYVVSSLKNRKKITTLPPFEKF